MTRRYSSKLFSRLRKEDDEFDDLCDARDEIIRVIAYHDIVKEALLSELKKWDLKVNASFKMKSAKMKRAGK